jgi:hypothetical protein
MLVSTLFGMRTFRIYRGRQKAKRREKKAKFSRNDIRDGMTTLKLGLSGEISPRFLI